jgi:hypothetical protein
MNRKQYDNEMKNERNRMPWRVFDPKHKQIVGKYESRTTGVGLSGVIHLYDGLKMNAIQDAPLDPSLGLLVPYIFHHGFGQGNEQYSG